MFKARAALDLKDRNPLLNFSNFNLFVIMVLKLQSVERIRTVSPVMFLKTVSNPPLVGVFVALFVQWLFVCHLTSYGQCECEITLQAFHTEGHTLRIGRGYHTMQTS